MNKSKEYVLSRIQSSKLTGFPAEKCKYANTISPIEILGFSERLVKYESTDIDHKYTIEVSIKYDPEADFDYCVVDYQMNDGTLLFQLGAFEDILNKIIRLKTCCATKIPNGELIDGDYKINYTIGDFVYAGYYDPDNAPEDNKWMSWNQKTVLPVKFDIKEVIKQ